MQNIAFVGKVYNKKVTGKGDKSRVNFSLAVRKEYVSDEDKKANKVNVFVPVVAFGKTAEIIDQYFENGSSIGIKNCEYTTYEYKDDEGDTAYGHNFKVGGFSFLPSGEDDGGSSSKKSSGRKSSRRDEEDEDEDERPRRKRTTSSRKEEKEDKPARRKRPVYDEDDDNDDGDVPF